MVLCFYEFGVVEFGVLGFCVMGCGYCWLVLVYWYFGVVVGGYGCLCCG